MEAARKVALVTGGAKRVGRAITLELARDGWDIAITYLSSAGEAEGVCGEVCALGRRALAVKGDLTKPTDAVAAIHAGVMGEYGRLDALVNNASLYEPSKLGSVSAADLDQMMAIHAAAPLLLCQSFEQALRAARGHVVNMIDLQAEHPRSDYLAYCASKAALANLTLSLAKALAPEVNVNGIAPGVVEWPPGMPEEQRQAYLRRVPLGRAGTPEDVAQLVRFLCSGASYITGQIIRLDGGRGIG